MAEGSALLKPVSGALNGDEETRLTLRLSPAARLELEWVAKQMDTSMTEVLKRSVGLQRLLLEVKQRRGRMLVEEPGQQLKEIVML